jgi:hypothetical protein
MFTCPDPDRPRARAPVGLARAGTLLLPLLLGACADRSQAADRRARYAALVGGSEAALIEALGQPLRRESVDGHAFLTYERNDVWQRGGVSGRGATGSVSFDCRATFVVADGVVNAYRLSGTGC